jgi:hypothetical protein
MGIATTLFSHAIQAYSENKITSDVLTNGVAYFTSNLLNWTLVGVVKMLIKESEMKRCSRNMQSICSPTLMVNWTAHQFLV